MVTAHSAEKDEKTLACSDVVWQSFVDDIDVVVLGSGRRREDKIALSSMFRATGTDRGQVGVGDTETRSSAAEGPRDGGGVTVRNAISCARLIGNETPTLTIEELDVSMSSVD